MFLSFVLVSLLSLFRGVGKWGSGEGKKEGVVVHCIGFGVDWRG
jgi:hypothetical protein